MLHNSNISLEVPACGVDLGLTWEFGFWNVPFIIS